MEMYNAALVLQTQSGQVPAEARTRRSLAAFHRAAGRTPEAVAEYRRSLALFEQIGNATVASEIKTILNDLASDTRPSPAAQLD
jgi:type IV secretory pathway TrbF-like protein